MTAIVVKEHRYPDTVRIYQAFFKVAWTGGGPTRILVLRSTWYTKFTTQEQWSIESQKLTVYGTPRRFVGFEIESHALDWLVEHAEDYWD